MEKMTIKPNENNDLKYRSGIKGLDEKKEDEEFKETVSSGDEESLEYFTE